MIQAILEAISKQIGEDNIKYVRDKFFKKVFRILQGRTANEIQDETKLIANKVVREAETQKVKNALNEQLSNRQKEIDKNRPPQELQQEKDTFKQRMYQATSNLKNEKSNSLKR